MSRLTPISTPGIMIGRVNAIRNARAERRRLRTSENAAAVPTTVLIRVTSKATRNEVLIADLQVRAVGDARVPLQSSSR